MDKKASKQARLAIKKYNPEKLCKLIKRDENDIIVDKSKIKNKKNYTLFNIILRQDYNWDYSNCKNMTIYLDYDSLNKKIYGGLYDEKDHRRLNCVEIASTKCTRYIYTEAKITRLIRKLYEMS